MLWVCRHNTRLRSRIDAGFENPELRLKTSVTSGVSSFKRNRREVDMIILSSKNPVFGSRRFLLVRADAASRHFRETPPPSSPVLGILSCHLYVQRLF